MWSSGRHLTLSIPLFRKAMPYRIRTGEIPTFALWTALATILWAGPARCQTSGGASSQSPDAGPGAPYDIVLCTDISGSMNENDPVYRDREGVETTLRDDGQLTFLTLLGEYFPKESFVGICKFSDRVSEGLPGGARDAPASGEALIPWRQVNDWRQLREQISTRKADGGGTRIETALRWAHRRIRLTRDARRTQGHGLVVLLSDGDPDRASGELRGGQVLGAARALADDGIRVYSIIVNKASYRQGRRAEALRGGDQAGEKLMELIGSTTGGKVYRITSTVDLLDVFTDIFAVVPSTPPIVNTAGFAVSSHHRSVVFIGPALSSIDLAPVKSGGAAKPYSLPLKDGLDETSGIERRVIPLTQWNIIVLQRPPDVDRLNQYWCGTWRPAAGGSGSRYDGRVYLITDFLLHLEVEPVSPCWVDERIRIRAQLAERPREVGEQTLVVPPLRGEDLSLSFVVKRSQMTTPLAVGTDTWNPSDKSYSSLPFQLSAPGRYVITCDCTDHVDNQSVSLGTFSTDLLVEQEPLSLVLRHVVTNEVVFPRAGGAASQAAAIRGGEQVFAELRSTGSLNLENVEGELRLSNAVPAQQTFHLDSGRLVTQSFLLPVADTRLAGTALVRLKRVGAIRELHVPNAGFDFFYGQRPPALACEFSDRRTALWVGERHQQELLISIFPVFGDPTKVVEGLLPRELSRACMRFLGGPGSAPAEVPVRCSLENTLLNREGNALRVTGVYKLQLGSPIPPSQQCEIDPGPVATGLRAEKKQYEVVDSVGKGLFAYRLFPAQDDALAEGIAETVYANEPIVFAATWADGQDVNNVVFLIREQGAGDDKEPIRILVPVSPKETSSQITRPVRELRSDKNYSVQVQTTCRPAGSGRDVTLQLIGGAFKAAERHLDLAQLVIGPGDAADVPGYALETLRLPLRAGFANYNPNNPDHLRLINQFKESCRLAAGNSAGIREDISSTVVWPGTTPPSEGPASLYWLEGHSSFTPKTVGHHTTELCGSMETQGAVGPVQRMTTAHCRLSVGPPRFTVKAYEIGSRGETLLFDSVKLVLGGTAATPVTNAYATQMRVCLDFTEAVQSVADSLIRVRVAVRRRNPSEAYGDVVFQQEAEFTRGHERAEFAIQDPPLKTPGEYFLEVCTASRGADGLNIALATPTLITIPDRPKPEPVIPPRGFLTAGARQWPFSYKVAVEPSWSFKPIDLSFEFQFSGMGKWLQGTISPGKDDTYFIVQNPDILAPLPEQAITTGPMRFRLRYMGQDRITWESAGNVQFVAPWLEGVDLICEQGSRKEVLPQGSRLPKPPFQLRVRPRFRTGDELQGWWTRRTVKVYLVSTTGGDAKLGDDSPEFLRRIIQAGEIDPNHAVFEIRDIRQEQEGVLVLDEPQVRRRFWGLPRFSRRDAYHVLVETRYEERIPGVVAPDATEAPPCREIREWTTARTIVRDVPEGMPYMWWPILPAVLACVLAQFGKRWVPAPEGLSLDIYLTQSGGAEIDPAGLNKTVADLTRPTSWLGEVRMYADHLRSRYPMMSEACNIAMLLAHARTFLSRAFLARRRLWLNVHLKAKEGILPGPSLLMCVRTSPLKKEGVLWSSAGGLHRLPGEKEPAVTIASKLVYRWENAADQVKQVPVVVRVGRKKAGVGLGQQETNHGEVQ